MAKIGARLTDLREEQGWSKTYTAKKLGIKAMSTYANWEYGNREPDVEMLTKIADLYEVTVDYLIGRSSIKNLEQLNYFNSDTTLAPYYKEFVNFFKTSKNLSSHEKTEKLQELLKKIEIFYK